MEEAEEPVVLPEIRGKIEFSHVWFAYDGENYVLRDVSFVIEPGQSVAFVGATGAGKSSILNLIGRYYDIQKGAIYIDDVDIRLLSKKQLRSAIGQMQQDVFIFEGTVESNIRLYNEEITEKEVREAAEYVNASHFIEKLPLAYKERCPSVAPPFPPENASFFPLQELWHISPVFLSWMRQPPILIRTRKA